MKILNIVINTEPDSIVPAWMNYLIDAGHYVYANSRLFTDPQAWYEHYTHNFELVTPSELERKDFDYALDIPRHQQPRYYPRLDAGIRVDGATAYLQALVITHEQAHYTVIRQQLHCPEGQSGALANIEQALGELFIDAVIYLSKYGLDSLPLADTQSLDYRLKDIFQLREEMTALKGSYDTLACDESFLTLSSGLHQPVYQTLSFDLKAEHFQEAELLVLYLLLQLNGRQAGIYGYDLARGSQTIPKLIACRLEDTYPALSDQLNHSRYQLVNHRLYSNDFELQTGVLVTFDNARKIGGYGVIFEFHSKEGQLSIHYDQGGDYWRCCDIVICQFKQALAQFKQRGISLEAFISYDTQRFLNLQQQWNDTYKPFDSSKLQALFEAQVARRPQAIAVSDQYEQLTYEALNQRAEQLATVINAHSKPSSGLVAIYTERGAAMLAAVLAVFKSGRAYVPLDLSYPQERLTDIINDCEPDLILTSDAHRDILRSLAIDVPLIALDSAEAVSGKALPARLPDAAGPENLAYVIYTSGTTGRPKGVKISHHSVINAISYFANLVNLTASDRLLAVTTLAFDISVLELLMPLAYGSEVVIADQDQVHDAAGLVKLIEDKQITVMQATPSLWHLVVQVLPHGKNLSIRALCGGEPLPDALLSQLANTVDQLWNVYGPTETTIWSAAREVQPDNPGSVIGGPIANTQCYILDENQRPLPAGALGELYIGGEGLAEGYFKRPQLTAEKFVDNPFYDSLKPDINRSRRLYKTGDLARWTAEGELDFRGRNDFQIKIRGHRVELGEIEAVLCELVGDTQSVVVVHTIDDQPGVPGKQYLAGYYAAQTPLDQQQLLDRMAEKLPDYMVPNALVALDELPLSVNGKLDRKALPIPDFGSDRYQAPRTDLEARVGALWADVLALSERPPNVYDDFFYLGGNSILAIQLVNRINHELNSDITIRDVFVQKTIADLAQCLAEASGEFVYKDYVVSGIDLDHLYEPFPINNVQQTYYWGRFDLFDLGNISTHVYSEFKYRKLDIKRLETAWNQLLQRHLALRTVFSEDQQRFLKEVPYYTIECYDIHSEQDLLAIREQYSHKVYSPERYPLFDIFVTRHQDFVLLHISFDAIIIDMSSFEILFQEWIQLYQQPHVPLQPLHVSFRDYMLQCQALRNSDLYESAKQYWINRLDDYHLEMNLPLACRPSEVSQPRFKRISKVIDKSVWQRAASQAQQLGVSLTALVLELYARTLCFWSGQDQLAVNLTLFNRLPLHEQVHDIIGDFTALELFAYSQDRRDSIQTALENSHQRLLNDLDHPLFDGIDLQRLLRQRHNISPSAIVSPVVLTSVLGSPDQSGLFNLPIDSSYEGIHYAISQTSQVWLDNKAYETEQGFVAEWDYVEQLFDPAIIEAMHATYCWLIEQVAAHDWSQPFPAIPLPEKDKAVINYANTAQGDYTEDTLVSAYARCLASPGISERPAVIDAARGTEYSHAELWRDSGRVAQALARGGGGQLVGVLSEKGYNQAVATLGIMRAGYAYLPLHVDWPAGRQSDVLSQGGGSIVLISRAQYEDADLRSALADYSLWVIESLSAAPVEAEQGLPDLSREAIAYVIFTSGSTGKPKGVTISHGGAMNTLAAVNERFGVNRTDRVLALSELSFDLSVYDLFGVLSSGGCVVFPEQGRTKEPSHWVDLIERHGVTLWNTVPQLAGLLIDELSGVSDSLRLFLLSGDWIPLQLPDRIKSSCPNAEVIGLGGATEGSIWSIWYPIERVDPSWRSIPYGYAMPNQQMYVLNRSLEHCPVGVRGEIYIGGAGVALNYWGRSDLTAAHFIEHPSLGRLYRTGDIGRWHAAGYMEFCGRDDDQVKIRGYRVELDEIRTKLEQIKGIDQAAVCLQQDATSPRLVAYLVADKSVQQTAVNETEQFKLQQKGLLTTPELYYQNRCDLTESRWRLRKSYRVFTEQNIDIHRAEQAVQQSKRAMGAHQEGGALTLERLTAALSAIAGLELPGRALPKYLYPSAGSTYAVRCLVTLPETGTDLPSGGYYYHPLEQGLAPSDLVSATAQPELHLVAHWPAIEPLYGHQSERLACLEAGHMVSLLQHALLREGIHSTVTIQKHQLDGSNTRLVRLTLGQHAPMSFEVSIRYLHRDYQGYVDADYNRAIDLSDLSLQQQASDYGRVLNNGRMLFVFEGAPSMENYIGAGCWAQTLSEQLAEHDIGVCPLGKVPHSQAVYALAAGAIDQVEKEKAESSLPACTLEDIINQRLRRLLPDYMIPQAYAWLEQLPLTANGKLATAQLPAIDFESAYAAPVNDQELELAEVWAELLGLESHHISRDHSFFELGGNSLLAMQLVHKLSGRFENSFKLTDIYRYSLLKELAEQCHSTEETREEGVI